MIHQILLANPAWILTAGHDSLNHYYGWQAGQLGSIAPASPTYRGQTLTGIYTADESGGVGESFRLYVIFASNPANQANIIVNVNGVDYTTVYFDAGAFQYWHLSNTVASSIFSQGVTYAVNLRD